MSTRIAVTHFALKICTALAVALAAMGVLAGTAGAASFDCSKAKSRLEVLICADAQLSSLDWQMGRSFSLLRSGVPTGSKEAAELLSAQRTFLKDRTKTCNSPANPVPSEADNRQTIACLESVYTNRVGELRHRLGCYAGETEIHVNGYSVKVKPTCLDDNGEPKACGPQESADGCGVVVTSPRGKIVDQDDGPYAGLDIDPSTGLEMGGEPVAVLYIQPGKAGSSPRGYDIISLGKTPGLIFGDLSVSCTVASADSCVGDGGVGAGNVSFDVDFEDLRGDGQLEVLINDIEGRRPRLILQLTASRIQDVSSKFWPVFEGDIQRLRGELNIQRLREIHSDPNQFVHDEETRSTVVEIIQDYLSGGRYDEAKGALTELWPPDGEIPAEFKREKTWKSIVSDYCDVRKVLHYDAGNPRAALEPGPLCSGK